MTTNGIIEHTFTKCNSTLIKSHRIIPDVNEEEKGRKKASPHRRKCEDNALFKE